MERDGDENDVVEDVVVLDVGLVVAVAEECEVQDDDELELEAVEDEVA